VDTDKSDAIEMAALMMDLIIRYIEAQPGCSRAQMMNDLKTYVGTPANLDVLLATLEAGKVVRFGYVVIKR